MEGVGVHKTVAANKKKQIRWQLKWSFLKNICFKVKKTYLYL